MRNNFILNWISFIMEYNIYYGTRSTNPKGKVQYRFTKNVKDKKSALRAAKESATTFYYKNGGKYGITTFSKVYEESNITGVPVKDLYAEHINVDMKMFVVPTNEDVVSTKDLKY